jgi:hypothetical protein
MFKEKMSFGDPFSPAALSSMMTASLSTHADWPFTPERHQLEASLRVKPYSTADEVDGNLFMNLDIVW